MESIVASTILWADALGIYGEFGRSDVADVNFLVNLANPYPLAGPNEVRGDQEGFWARVHYNVGFTLGLMGIDRESAKLLMETWEWTEPGIFTGWGWFDEYQGRDYFEDGWEIGAVFDIKTGLEGYDAAQYWILFRDD